MFNRRYFLNSLGQIYWHILRPLLPRVGPVLETERLREAYRRGLRISIDRIHDTHQVRLVVLEHDELCGNIPAGMSRDK